MIDLPRLARIEGPGLVLRLIRPGDAEYLHTLRTNQNYNKHLSVVSGTAQDQRRWIESYMAREADGRELYYVIERKDGLRCGFIRLYDIAADSFTWGSWVLDANKPAKAALESAMLSFGVGFDHLQCSRALIDVRIGNEQALAFYIRLGMTELHRDQKDIYFTYTRQKFVEDRSLHMKIIQQEAQT